MFLIVLDYVADLSDVDAALGAHNEWLDKQYEDGLFVGSGRREPRVGGVVLAHGDRTEVEAAVANDPFAVRGLAEHTIIEFHPSRFGYPLDTDEVRSALS
ncbi:MAG: YciI family protein [Brevibacterium linens]